MTAVTREHEDTVHFLKNQLSIILGFAALLAEQVEDGSPLRADIEEIEKAAQAALGHLSGLLSPQEQPDQR
jgi:hypothetical protein